jgi:hypothetical protein
VNRTIVLLRFLQVLNLDVRDVVLL